jgi:hypothetical protein
MSLSTPTTNDVKIVTDYANSDSNGAYNQDQVRPVLNIIHEVFITQKQIPCWSQEEAVVQAVLKKNPKIPLAFGATSNKPEDFVRVFVRKFLSALHAGAYSVPKPECNPQTAPNGFAASQDNKTQPQPPFDLVKWAGDNPVLAVGAVGAVGVIAYALWKTIFHKSK